jgi:hypothetical protein
MCFYYSLQVVFSKRHGENGLYVVYYFNFIFPLFMVGIVQIVVFVVALCRLAGWYEYSRKTCCLCLRGWRIRYEFVTDSSLHGVKSHTTIFWTSQLLVGSLSCEWVVARYKGSHYTFGKILSSYNIEKWKKYERCYVLLAVIMDPPLQILTWSECNVPEQALCWIVWVLAVRNYFEIIVVFPSLSRLIHFSELCPAQQVEVCTICTLPFSMSKLSANPL